MSPRGRVPGESLDDILQMTMQGVSEAAQIGGYSRREEILARLYEAARNSLQRCAIGQLTKPQDNKLGEDL